MSISKYVKDMLAVVKYLTHDSADGLWNVILYCDLSGYFDKKKCSKIVMSGLS